jgi:outer membrane protein insertion porin family
VVAIEVRGNKNVPTEQILPVIQIKVGDEPNDEKIRADVRAILDLGLFADVNARLERIEGGVRLVFIVIENPIVSEIIVEGNTVVPTEEIQTALGVPVGQVLNFTTMRAGARAVEKLYESKGYVLARLTDLSIIPTEAGGGRLRLKVGEGIIEAIRFEGLTKTKEIVVRRQLKVKQGDVFNINLLNKDLQRVFDLGLFESVRAQPRLGTTPDSAIIVIEVKEARTGQIGFGIGYSDVYGLLGGIEFRDRNWQGLGQTLVVRADRSIQTGTTTYFNYEISLTEPYLDDTDALNLSLFSSTSNETEYTGGSPTSRFQLQRTGAIAQVTRRFDLTTSLAARLRSERADITPLQLNPPDPFSPPPSFFSPGRVVSIGFAWTRDTRNDKFAPISGSKIVAGTEFAIQQLGGDFSFVKYTGEYTQFFPIGSASAIVARLAGGTSSGQLPLQEQFTLGGPSTIRAYPGGRFRADTYVLTNLEFRFPLGSLFEWLSDIQGIVFADAGIYRPVTVGSSSFSSPVGGYGVGIAVKTPVGPFRIDFAFGPEGRQTWLSLGAPF